MNLAGLILLSLALGLAAWLFFLWTVKSGQYEDPEGAKHRMMEDDEGLPGVKTSHLTLGRHPLAPAAPRAYVPPMPRVAEIEVVEDYTDRARLDEGFLRLKRLRARNRRVDGTYSRTYPIDLVDRPTLDAVAVCVWARTPRGVEILTRRGLRPAAFFRRGKRAVLPEPEYLLVEELVAGVLEPGEVGLEALRRRGADEVREEAGLELDPAGLRPLGGPFFPLPGIVSEKIHLLEVEVEKPAAAEGTYDAPHEGDGSPLEEGALLTWRELGEALAACEAGEIEDAKTELALRRLVPRLGVP